MWIMYLAGRSKAGVIIDRPGSSGANGLAAASSLGPAALWITPDIPLPASNDGFAESTNMSEFAVRMF